MQTLSTSTSILYKCLYRNAYCYREKEGDRTWNSERERANFRICMCVCWFNLSRNENVQTYKQCQMNEWEYQQTQTANTTIFTSRSGARFWMVEKIYAMLVGSSVDVNGYVNMANVREKERIHCAYTSLSLTIDAIQFRFWFQIGSYPNNMHLTVQSTFVCTTQYEQQHIYVLRALSI